MTLFMFDVASKKKLYRVLVHAENGMAARAHLRGKFPGCDMQNASELPSETKHFVLAEEDRI